MSDSSGLHEATPDGYADWLAELKTRIHLARQRATLAVNRELVVLYWQIGHDILERQAEQGWGARVIDRLSRDLRVAFPDMKGFSPRNLTYMRAFAEAWPDVSFVQEVLAQLPWYHQLALLEKLPDAEARRWYAARAIEHTRSRNVLVLQIETNLGDRSGAAVTNFERSFPAPQESQWKRVSDCRLTRPAPAFAPLPRDRPLTALGSAMGDQRVPGGRSLRGRLDPGRGARMRRRCQR